MADRVIPIRPGYRRSIRFPDGSGRWKQEPTVDVAVGDRIIVQPEGWVAPAPEPPPPPAPVPTPTPTPPPAQTGDLQALINAAAPGSTINYGGTHSGSVIVNKPLTIIGGRVNGKLTITASDVTLRQMVVLGPQFAQYVSSQDAIYAANVRNLTLDCVEAGKCGNAGVRLHYVTGFTILAPKIHDAVYAGIITTSSTDGLIDSGLVERIGMNGSSAANSNNAYGISLSSFLPTHPKAARITVRGVTVRDVPTWTGLDTHGGQDIVFENNRVERTWRGVFITGPGGQRVTVRNNSIDRAAYMGIVAYDNTAYSITGNTVSNCPSDSIYVTANSCGTLGPNTIVNSAPIRDEGGRC